MTSPNLNEDQTRCPDARRLKAWLDERAELNPDELVHLRSCASCDELLSRFTDAPELLPNADHWPQSDNLYRNEEQLQILRENLANLTTPPEPDQFSTITSFKAVATPRNDIYDTIESDAFDSDAIESRASTDFIRVEEDADLSVAWLQAHMPEDRYSILRKLAVGGSGAVYLAYDNKLSRDVAIKVLVRQSIRDRQRMRREAKILAELDHPNVVRVFDVDHLHTGNPQRDAKHAPLYIVMEYLAGGSIEHLRLSDFKKLACLLEQAAAGLAKAHQQGLIHRDIKPANLLIDGTGDVLKVADFGLARMLDDTATHVTRTGEIVGTPAYMSPEQLQIIDTFTDHVSEDSSQPEPETSENPSAVNSNLSVATDIYSLGATLYHLLLGQPPFLGTTTAVLRQIVEVEPVRPRVLEPRIPVDLETICLHAMEKVAKNRYKTIEDFQADLRSFIDSEPIAARPVSLAQRTYRYLRNHRSIAGSLLAIVALIMILLSGSLFAVIVYQNQNARLRTAIQQSNEDRQAAEQAVRKSIEAADQLLVSVADDADLLPRTAGSQQVTEQLLLRARDFYMSFLTANAENRSLSFELAKAHAGLAKIAARTGTLQDVEKHAQQSIQLLNELDIATQANESEVDVTPSQYNQLWADTLIIEANAMKETSLAHEAIEIYEAALSRLRPYTTLDTNPGTHLFSEALASQVTALRGLAEALLLIGKSEEALPRLAESLELLDRLYHTGPGQPRYLRDSALVQMTFATTAIDRGNLQEGKERLMAANDLLDQVSETDDVFLRVRELKGLVQTNLGLTERRLGNTSEAKKYYDQAISTHRRLIELEPFVASHKWNLVVAAMNSGGPELDLGRLEPLVERWRETLPVLEKLIIDDSNNQRYRQVRAMLNSNIAIILRDLGKYEEAIEPLQQATQELLEEAIRLDKAPEAYLPVALNHYELANTYFQLEEYQTALDALNASDAIVNELLDKHPDFTPAKGHHLDSMLTRFQVLRECEGVPHEAMISVAQSSVDLANTLTSNHPDTFDYKIDLPETLINRGDVRYKNGQTTDAIADLKAAMTHLQNLTTEETQTDVQRLLKKSTTKLVEILLAELENEKAASAEFDLQSDALQEAQRQITTASRLDIDADQLEAFQMRLSKLTTET